MIKIDPILTVPAPEKDLDFEKQAIYNSHLGRSLSEYSGILSTRVNKLLPKDGSEVFTGDLAVEGGLGVLGFAAIGGPLTVGTNLTPIGAPGSVVDSSFASYTANANLGVTPIDDSIPQVGEGTEILSVALTPKSSLNKIRITFIGQGAVSVAGNTLVAAAFVNGATNAVKSTVMNGPSANFVSSLVLNHEYTPGSTSIQTITIRVGVNAGVGRLNGTSAARFLGGSMSSTVLLEEIKG